MGATPEQTTAILDGAAKLVKAVQSKPDPDLAGWVIPLAVTIGGGIITTIFGVWYAKKRKKKP